MTVTYKGLVQGASLTGPGAAVYTAPAATSANISAVSVSNPTAGVVALSMHIVPAGGTATNLNRIALKNIAAGAVVPVSEAVNHKLEPGEQLYASGAGLGLTVSGTEYVA